MPTIKKSEALDALRVATTLPFTVGIGIIRSLVRQRPELTGTDLFRDWALKHGKEIREHFGIK